MLDGMVNLERVHGAKVEKGVSGGTRDFMEAEPNPSHWEVLAGMVERVTYQNVENGFCVIRVKVRGHRELVTVVGPYLLASGSLRRANGLTTVRMANSSRPGSSRPRRPLRSRGSKGILRRG